MSTPSAHPSPASPERVPAGLQREPTGGHFTEGWITEETRGTYRHSYRVNRLLHEERSPYQKIAVYESDFMGRILTLDDVMMLTERDEFVYHEMLAHVPLLTLPEPRTVLVIGGGDLGIVREALKHPSIERVVLCEIDERVTRVCEEYFPWLKPTLDDPRLELCFDDAVRYVEDHPTAFDLVVVDSTDPQGPAVGLFLRDFYRDVCKALKPGGVMTAQTESPFWESSMVKAIYQELRQAFDHVAAYLGFTPTYPSGMWSWAYASASRRPTDHFDRARAERIAESCRYYHPGIQEAAFVLPTFVRQVFEDGEAALPPGQSP